MIIFIAILSLLLSTITANDETNIFDETYVSITIPKNYQRKRPLPFVSPSILADVGESFRLSLLQTEYSNDFIIVPEIIVPGQQFDIILDDTHILNVADKIKLQVEAKSTRGSRHGVFTLDINVEKVVFERLFEADEYTFEVPTYSRTAKVGIIKLVNGIPSENIKYTIYGSMANYFSLETKADHIVELISLECSSECYKIPRQFALMIRAIIANRKQPYDVPISIKLTGNDDEQRPHFKQSAISLNLKEKSVMNNPLLIEFDNSNDANLTFLLNDYSPIFEINEKFGILSIQNSELLTIDNLGERFNMTVSMCSGKNEIDTAIIMVTLSPVIDHQTMAPKFSHNVYAFAANPGESFVGQVFAQSLDGDITYLIAEGGATLFRINATDGRIFYHGPLNKDPRNYELKVIAIDESSPPYIDIALVQVLIAGLGSSPAKFKTKEPALVTINKTSGAGTVLHQFTAIDADPNAKVMYSINSLKAYDDLGNVLSDSSQLFEHFRFRKNGLNDGTLQLAKSFKNTSIMAFWTNISATDISHPDEPDDKAELLVQLIVPEKQISNEDLVKFDQLRSAIEIPENAALGTYIYTVNVKPLPANLVANHHVLYSISKGHRGFAINPITGVITTATKLHVQTDYNITVTASDPNTQVTSSTSISIKVKPSMKQRTPIFANDSYTFAVVENAPQGTVVGTLMESTNATTEIKYTIVGNAEIYFKINKKGTIHTLLPLDYENKSVFHFIINASYDNGPFTPLPITVNVMDENDVEPRFPERSYSATIMENSPINTFIINAQAVDEDSSLEYSLMMNSESSALSSLLRVDKDGSIRNVKPLLGLEGRYQFAVIARDGQHTGASATVFLTILPTSKCQPTFPETVPNIIYVNENEFPGATLAKFTGTVSSDDCQITYAIWDGVKYVGETELFVIDALTAELKAKKMFDCEKNDRYALVIAAFSGDLFAELDIEVRVVDQNDNPIEVIDDNVFFSIPEDENVGLLITKIRAFDRDINDKVYFHLKDDKKKFTIGRMDGILKLADKLDREKQDFYELYIMLTNSGEPPDTEDDVVFAIVKIMVLDVNDNGPVFENDMYTKAIPRDAIAGMEIVKVLAMDPDLINASSLNSDSVRYGIDETIYRYADRVRQANGFVNVDEKSGIVRLAQSPYDSAEMDIDESAKNLDINRLENLTETISELCECEVLLFNMKYINADGHLLRQTVRAQFLFINQTNDALLPADRAISIIDKKALNPKMVLPKLNALSKHIMDVMKLSDTVPYSHFREAALLLAIFTILLFSVLIVFAMILCYHRSKFIHEKKMYEDEKIAAGSMNKINRHRQPSSYVKSVEHNLREKYPNKTDENIYTTQEIKMFVGVDDTMKRVRYANND
ncbi:Cadherin-23 [Dirofilaria immitis]